MHDWPTIPIADEQTVVAAIPMGGGGTGYRLTLVLERKTKPEPERVEARPQARTIPTRSKRKR